jgi:hypothetical protein
MNMKKYVVWKKSISKGIRFNLFMSAYAPGSNQSPDGVLKEEWDTTSKQVCGILAKYLGPNLNIEIKPYSPTEKFQVKFETYIMHQEMAGQ